MSANNLDFQKMHLAPKPVQILLALGLAVLLVVAGFFVQFQDQWNALESAKQQEEQFKQEYRDMSVRAANLDNLKQELVAIEASIEQLIKQLPTEAEVPNLIQELYQAGAKNGLTMSLITPYSATQEDANIQRLPFSISVVGTYEKLASFVQDVGQMSRIVTLSSIEITGPTDTKDPKMKNKLTLKAVASTYKAVDAVAASQASGAASAASAASGAQ